MNMISEDKLTDAFVAAFKDVVEPGLNLLQSKVDGMDERLGEVEKRLTKVENSLDTVQIKLTKIDQRLERQGKVQDELQKKVGFLTAN